jgi:CheY-specific phosphatase CheX
MNDTKIDPQELLESFAEDACVQLFSAYGVELKRIDAAVATHPKALLTSVVGFSGPKLRGACILAATERPIQQSNPVDGPLRNWMAELSNQLVGRIKNKLLTHGAEVYVTTPVVLRGEHLAPLPRYELAPQLFECDGGAVFVWVEVENDPDFRLVASPDAVVAEGDALLF